MKSSNIEMEEIYRNLNELVIRGYPESSKFMVRLAKTAKWMSIIFFSACVTGMTIDIIETVGGAHHTFSQEVLDKLFWIFIVSHLCFSVPILFKRRNEFHYKSGFFVPSLALFECKFSFDTNMLNYFCSLDKKTLECLLVNFRCNWMPLKFPFYFLLSGRAVVFIVTIVSGLILSGLNGDFSLGNIASKLSFSSDKSITFVGGAIVSIMLYLSSVILYKFNSFFDGVIGKDGGQRYSHVAELLECAIRLKSEVDLCASIPAYGEFKPVMRFVGK